MLPSVSWTEGLGISVIMSLFFDLRLVADFISSDKDLIIYLV